MADVYLNYDSLLWGKRDPFYALSRHMIDAGECARVYLESPSSRAILNSLCAWMGTGADDAIGKIAYVAAMHDIGKAHPLFQILGDADREKWRQRGFSEACGMAGEPIRHEEYGKRVVMRLWKDDKGLFPDDERRFFSSMIRLHHQGKPKRNERNHVPGVWEEIQRDLDDRMRRVFAPGEGTVNIKNRDALGVLLTAVVILCDWVASSDEFGMDLSGTDDARHTAWARERARKTLAAFGLISDKERGFVSDADFCKFWPTLKKEGLRPLQIACEKMGNEAAWLTIIEAPMGEGKTEAGLYLAGRLCEIMGKHGIYMALPTSATSNQMYGRIEKLMGAHGMERARLLHGMAWMIDDKSPDDGGIVSEDAREAAAWLRPLRRGMLSENAVGTVDQAMAAVLKIKYGMLRLEGLASKVLIIDEIHAYDVYMSRIIERLLQWCKVLNIPVILLSATLQKRQKEKYVSIFSDEKYAPSDAYPLITRVGERGLSETPVDGVYMRSNFKFKTVRVADDYSAIARMALERVAGGGCLCVLMNTVKRARAVYNALKLLGGAKIAIFHARFRSRARAEIEAECVRLFGSEGKRPEKMILVCTQVVEQSLDVDFDGMITDLAPMDLLLQRAGRVHRHRWRARPDMMKNPEIWVIAPNTDASVERRYGASGAVYAPCVLWGTERLLGEGRDVRVPEDVRECVERVYGDFDEAAIEAYVKKQIKDQMDECEADGGTFRAPEEESFFGQSESENALLSMGDTDEFNIVAGARTRNGEGSVRIAFLPEDFGEMDDSLEGRKKILAESVSLVLTNIAGYDKITASKENNKMIYNNQLHCFVLRPEADGSYRIGETVFIADDEVGVYRKE